MSARRPIALITGASGGIGAELARVFAQHGHELALVARRAEQLDTLADEIAATGRPRPNVLPFDLGQPGVAAQIGTVLQERGIEPAFVVNNAGFGLYGAAAELDRARQLAMIDLNVRALTDLSLHFVDSLKRHRGGLLNVASVAGFLPGPNMAIYHATKAYAVSFSEALHRELAPFGVRVTVLCPGPVETAFFEQSGVPDDYFPRRLYRSAERIARDGYKGLIQGRRVVVPGADNRILVMLPRLLPRALVLSMIRGGRSERSRNRRT